MKKQPVIKVIKVEPMKRPAVIEMKNELEAMQGIVGGWIEVLPIDPDVAIVCNEEGKLNGLPLNRGLRKENGELWEVIAGTFFIAGDDLSIGEFVSLTEEQIEKYMEQFMNPEVFMNIGGKIMGIPVMPEGDE